MRKQIWIWYILVAISLVAGTGCKKDPIIIVDPVQPPPPSPPPPPPTPNTAPRVHAGEDLKLAVPTDSARLRGWVTDTENNVTIYVWKQVAGPSQGTIETPGSVQTKVTKLVKGTYEFELTVTDDGGLSARDTVAVIIRDPAAPGSGEVVIQDLQWSCPWGCWLEIQCFSCLVPPNQPFKVYLRQENSNQWIEVIPEANWTGNEPYVYGIENNNLWIYSDYGGDGKADVKITF